MPKRFVAIWFRHLLTDWLTLRQHALQKTPFVVASPDHGRMLVTAASRLAMAHGIVTGTLLADARAIIPSLEVFDHQPGQEVKLLNKLAEWCIRFTPLAAIESPDGLILDVSGCTHLWGGERGYLKEIQTRIKNAGYNVRSAMADTIGCAWAISRFGKVTAIIESGREIDALLTLPPASLRLSPDILLRLQKLGLNNINSFIGMPRSALRRRFGQELLNRIDQATGREEEIIKPVQPMEPFQERLPCLEPIITATGIEIALKLLLEKLCHRLQQEEKGLRTATFKGYRLDGKMEQVEIGTHCASYNATHLFKLFEPKIVTIEPDLGIELFTLEALKTEDAQVAQQKLWAGTCGLGQIGLAELLDRLANRIGADNIHRYLPAEHYWPERSIKAVNELHEKATTPWQVENPRPTQLLSKPEPIEVTAPVPDYPPMLFRYKGRLHKIKKADGPERIESEWWLEEAPPRDYYKLEDEDGQRYWVFRSGPYTTDKQHQWFIHGFFA